LPLFGLLIPNFNAKYELMGYGSMGLRGEIRTLVVMEAKMTGGMGMLGKMQEFKASKFFLHASNNFLAHQTNRRARKIKKKSLANQIFWWA
jgi:hypothetical protein